MSDSPTRPSNRRRIGIGLALLAVLVLAGLSLAMLPRSKATLLDQPVTKVVRGPMSISVVESGTVRPREQLILKNELDDPATILSIVEEGTEVKKGDLLCELDVTASKNALTERRIRVQSAESAMIFAEENMKIAENQGQADIDAAVLLYSFAQKDLVKYVEGEYPRLLKDAESKITIAREEVTRARDVYEWSKKLFDESYLSRSELDRDDLTMKKSKLAVELAEADLELLKKFTHERQLETLQSAVKQSQMALERTKRKVAASMVQAQSDVKAKAALLEEERNKLKELEDQVAKAKIFAPIDGMVLYASSSDRWDYDDPPIREGTPVDERGEIIHLPTIAAFNVETKILEVNLRKVRAGMPVRVTVDALPGLVLTGKVVRIAPLPDSQSRWMNPNLKLYNTYIQIDNPDPALRNGMSCRVEILVDKYDDALSVPIQAVTRVGGQPMVYAVEKGLVVAKPVELGLDNSRFVRIVSGLNGDESILLAPPFSEDKEEEKDKEKKDDKPRENGGGNKGPSNGGGRST